MNKKPTAAPSDVISDEQSAENTFKRELSKRLSEFGSAPILFAGSGLSRRYRGLPDWEGLLEKLASYTEKSFAYYRSTANGDLAMIASLMIEDLHSKMWEEDGFADKRTKYEQELINRQSALKVLVAEIISVYENISDPELEEELRLFRKIEVDAIITTNFDDLLEKVFPDFRAYVGQDELLIADPQGVGEIYKIHGSIEKPNSIVITKEDFDEYSNKYPYLAAKLMTFFAEHPVIFIGYSMSDKNIINILDSLVKCMDAQYISKLQDRLIFVKRGKKLDISGAVISTSGVQIPVINVVVPNFKDLFEVLGSLERKFPAHILRRLKERVYELVLTNDPAGKLYVDNIENEPSDSVDVVLGVGIVNEIGTLGYESFNRTSICMHVLNGDKKINAKELLSKTIPPLQGVVPIIGYMLKAGYLNSNGTIINDQGLNERIRTRYESNLSDSSPSESVRRQSNALALSFPTFDELAANNDEYHTLITIRSLKPENINHDNLKKYLLKCADKAKSDGNFRSTWSKAVCLYDRLINLDRPW